MSVKDQGHFLEQSELPQIEGSALLRDVFERLNRSGRGGFIMLEEGQPRHYVKATEFAEAVVDRANRPGTEKLEVVSGTSVSSFLDQDFTRAFFVPISGRALDVTDDDASLKEGPDTVYLVAESGRPTGYYGNRETVFTTAVKIPRFYCEMGHENTSVGDGTCGQCPYPIVTVKSE